MPTTLQEEFELETDRFQWYIRKQPKNMELYANIMECYFGLDMQIDQIAMKFNLHITQISRIISLYWQKPEFDLTIPSRI